MSNKAIPAVTLPEKGYDLLSDFAHSKKMSMAEAVRYLLTQAQELREFAKQDQIEEYFAVSSWGGNRRGEAKPAKSDE